VISTLAASAAEVVAAQVPAVDFRQAQAGAAVRELPVLSPRPVEEAQAAAVPEAAAQVRVFLPRAAVAVVKVWPAVSQPAEEVAAAVRAEKRPAVFPRAAALPWGFPALPD